MTPEAEKLVIDNQGLAVYIAVKIMRQRFPFGYENFYDDFTGEAMSALVKAANDFDPERGLTFSAYAGMVIRDHVRGYVTTLPLVKVGKQAHAIARLGFMTQLELEERLGRTPTTPELQEELYVICLRWADERLPVEARHLTGEARVEAQWERLKRSSGTTAAVRNIQAIMAAVGDQSSLDFELDSDGLKLQDVMVDESLPETGADLEALELRQAIADALYSQCSAQQRAILLARYGFLSEDSKVITRDVVGVKAGVSGQAISMRQEKALRMLRTSPRREALRSHTDGGPDVAGHLPSAPLTLDEMIDEAKILLDVA